MKINQSIMKIDRSLCSLDQQKKRREKKNRGMKGWKKKKKGQT